MQQSQTEDCYLSEFKLFFYIKSINCLHKGRTKNYCKLIPKVAKNLVHRPLYIYSHSNRRTEGGMKQPLHLYMNNIGIRTAKQVTSQKKTVTHKDRLTTEGITDTAAI